jgi:endonuclease/exonuclease/phosphatase (EEP) superfamily protein YafD
MPEDTVDTDAPQDPSPSPTRRFTEVPAWVPRAFFILTLGTTALLAILYLLLSDRTWWSECLTIWPSFLWCLGLVPMALFTLSLRRPRCCLILLGVILLFLLLTVEWRSLIRWPNGRLTAEFAALRESPGESDDTALRLVVWNVADYMSNRLDVLSELEPLSPDLCFLQETGDGRGSFQPEDLVGPWEGFHWLDEGDCGLLSRYPIHSLTPPSAYPVGTRMQATLELPSGDRALIANVHLTMPALAFNIWIKPFPRNQVIETHRRRLAEYTELLTRIDAAREEHDLSSVILAGDFNVPGRMATLAPFRERFHDVWRTGGIGWGATMTAEFPVARIDHCWVTDDIEPVAARVHPTEVSDHRILVIDMLIHPTEE